MVKTAKEISDLPFVRSQRSLSERFNSVARSSGRSTRRVSAFRKARTRGRARVARLKGKKGLKKILYSFSR